MRRLKKLAPLEEAAPANSPLSIINCPFSIKKRYYARDRQDSRQGGPGGPEFPGPQTGGERRGGHPGGAVRPGGNRRRGDRGHGPPEPEFPGPQDLHRRGQGGGAQGAGEERNRHHSHL